MNPNACQILLFIRSVPDGMFFKTAIINGVSVSKSFANCIPSKLAAIELCFVEFPFSVSLFSAAEKFFAPLYS